MKLYNGQRSYFFVTMYNGQRSYFFVTLYYGIRITVLLLESLYRSACRVERLSVHVTIVLLRLCCNVVATSSIAVTSAYKTEQKSDNLKNE